MLGVTFPRHGNSLFPAAILSIHFIYEPILFSHGCLYTTG